MATPAYAYLTGTGFYSLASRLRHRRGRRPAGGSDAAYLYDSAGSDAFVATPTYAYLAGPGSFTRRSGSRRWSA